MSDQYVGEIRMFAGNYAPENWHFCDGSLLSISQYNTLYSLIGNTYGGDGVSTFALPDLRGRLPIGYGTGAGLTARPLGQYGGSELVELTEAEMPIHTHAVNASKEPATNPSPVNNFWASVATDKFFIARSEVVSPSIVHDMNQAAIGQGGGSQAHNNVMPSFPLSFIIALTGYWPDRS